MVRRRTFLWKHGPASFCALRYKQYHACTDGQYDFQLRRNGCLAKMGCKPKDYPYLPTFKCCSELQIYPCAGAWMGGTHPCSRASLPMRWCVDGRHPPLLTCLSAHALERGWEASTLAHVPLCP